MAPLGGRCNGCLLAGCPGVHRACPEALHEGASGSAAQTCYIFQSGLYEVTGNVYGDTWAKEVTNRLQKFGSHQDWPGFRSLSGCLQWLAGQCRLDIASTVSLSNAGSDVTYGNLQGLYEALQFVKDSADSGIVLRPIPIDVSTTVVAYSDASWANAPGSASQHGQLLLLAANVTETTWFRSVVDWKSGRSKRVCRSTLAAESVAAGTATDRIAYIVYALSELIFGIPAHRIGPRLKSLLVTDCKSLYDCVSSSNPSIEGKRSLVSVGSTQEFINAKTVHWVPTLSIGRLPHQNQQGPQVQNAGVAVQDSHQIER